MQVIFGTPTATPPAWLTEKYPEVLNASKDGVLYRHGGRKHYNYNAPIYRERSARIVEKAAAHYGGHPAIVGWQIDNELNCETCEFYSEADSAAFRVYLRDTYQTLDKLNEAWGTVFWNQTYTDWEQIHVPRPTLNLGINPHQHLDYIRFISHSTLAFCKMQADIIRKYKKSGDFITTNGMFDNVDNHLMEKECLDVYTYDSYPSFAFGLDRDPAHADDLNDRKWTMHLNEVRSICPHFGIMEQQSGANGWTTRMEGPAPRPGQLALWAMQSVAHGADFISFFRWRTCTVGTEIYWHGILDYDNRDNRKLTEVKDFYQKFRTLDPVCGAEHAAAIENRIGKGRVIHFGSAFSRNNVRALFEYAGIKSPFQEYIEAPDTVEVVLRRKGGREFLFVLNFQAEEVSYVLKRQTRMLYTGETASGGCRLGAFGTAVYEV